MPKVSLLVKPKKISDIGWFVHLTSWSSTQKDLIVHRLNMEGENDGVYELVSEADLPDGIYEVRLHIVGAGQEVAVEVKGKPPIRYPSSKQWPLSVKVPAAFTQKSDAWYFQHASGDQ